MQAKIKYFTSYSSAYDWLSESGRLDVGCELYEIEYSLDAGQFYINVCNQEGIPFDKIREGM